MRDRSHPRLTRLFEWTPDAFWPDAVDETVVHEPCGRPWLVCTSDRRWRQPRPDVAYPVAMDPDPDLVDALDGGGLIDSSGMPLRYETQVFYTARAGVRGLPTGYGERYVTREAAVRGHRRWCLMVRLGEVMPDQPPDTPLV